MIPESMILNGKRARTGPHSRGSPSHWGLYGGDITTYLQHLNLIETIQIT